MVVTTLMPDQRKDGEDENYASAVDGQPEAMALNEARSMGSGAFASDGGEPQHSREEELPLPQSTHSFLFTEPVGSVSFIFGLGIAAVSYSCLVLALINNWGSSSVPANVVLSVRIAQYLSIFITLLMEEEIPTGLYLLRRISESSLKARFPEISYPRFVFSSALRITMGYLFLINVLIILIQAEGVIEIFYDCLALQFIQMLDDIGFNICKMEVLGKCLHRATMTPYFQFNFQEEESSLGLRWKMKICLKAAYFINLAIFLSAMIIVSVRQMDGYYMCESVTVGFEGEIWPDAIVQWPSDTGQYYPGAVTEMVLVYTYFNGEYARDATRLHEGRPIYVEQKKSGRAPFDKITPTYSPYEFVDSIDSIKPAEIKYCGGRWTFSHEYIRKSKNHESGETDCNWLARSPETDGFDLLDVNGKWQIWTDKIVETDISIRCSRCYDDDDCNLNGICNTHGDCDCDGDEDVVYLGTHCEVKLEDKCRTIIGEQYSDTWSVDASAWMAGPSETMEQQYSRPVYSYVTGLPEGRAPREGDSLSLIYSGSRWFMIYILDAQDETASEYWAWQASNYHAFWAGAYDPDVTNLISEPTNNDSPVGVDFSYLGERGDQYGPFGLLTSAQKDNVSGRGLFRCEEKPVCSFCSISTTIDPDYVVPQSGGYTCGNLTYFALSSVEGSIDCQSLKMAESICCPMEEEEACSFCSSDTLIDKDYVVFESDGNTCGNLFDYASSMREGSSDCQQVKMAEPTCCPVEERGCSFCSSGTLIDKDYVVSGSDGYICGNLFDYASSMEEGSSDCQQMKMAEPICCPP